LVTVQQFRKPIKTTEKSLINSRSESDSPNSIYTRAGEA
jgi:hypothetical protein